MSQNDFTIANQGFPAFRADLNSALQALASNSSGTSAPSTTFANMWWYDSANNIMYIRNEDNDAWIKFAELDQTNDKFVLSGTLQLDDGTVSAPALTFNSDTNMGIYRGGTDILKFVTAGVDAITIDASQNVAIGHTSTGGSNFAICDGANSAIQFFPEISTDTNLIQHYDQTATAYMNSEHRANSHIFKIGTSNAVKIDSSSNLLVGKTSTGFGTAGVELSQNGVAGKVFMTRSGGESLSLNRLSSDGEIVGFYKDSTLVGSIGVTSSDQFWIARNTGNQGIKFKNSALMSSQNNGQDHDNAQDLGTSSVRWKDLYLSGGAYIGGTGSANKLDDYEEGTFDPIYLGATTNPSVTYDTNIRYGAYTKIGRICYFNLVIRTDVVSSTGSGTLRIGGLPFTASNAFSTSTRYQVSIGRATNFNNARSDIVGEVEVSNTYFQLYYNHGINGFDTTELVTGTNQNQMEISGFYVTT